MSNRSLILVCLLILAIGTLVSYELRRRFKIYDDEQKKAFGSLGKTTVVKTISNKWKPKIIDATVSWIMNNDPEWKAIVIDAANTKGITLTEAANQAANYLWDNNVLYMFREQDKNDPSNSWRFYWTVNQVNLLKLSIKEPLLTQALSKIQNQPAINI